MMRSDTAVFPRNFDRFLAEDCVDLLPVLSSVVGYGASQNPAVWISPFDFVDPRADLNVTLQGLGNRVNRFPRSRLTPILIGSLIDDRIEEPRPLDGCNEVLRVRASYGRYDGE